jgi:hypothetical protein
MMELEENKPLEDRKYSLITFLSNKRRPDIYLNSDVIKGQHYRIKEFSEDKEEDQEMKETNDEDSEKVEFHNRRGNRYFDTNLSIKCWNCGGVGHIADRCSEEVLIICSKCNQTGHDRFQCKNVKCFKCNRIGHKSQDCNVKEVLRCERCGHTNHKGYDCLSKPEITHSSSSEKYCRFCNSSGHLVCGFPKEMYIISEYDSDNVVFSDEEFCRKDLPRKKINEKCCPRCSGDHRLESCRERVSENFFDKVREKINRKDTENNYKLGKRDVRHEQDFLNFANKSKKTEGFRFNFFKK